MTAPAAILRHRREVVPSPVLAMAIFLFAEIMFFCGLVAAYLVLRGEAGSWPPVDQPRLPVFATGVNTVVLAVSGVTMWRAVAELIRGDQARFRRLASITLVLGASFVVIQGLEWIRLVSFGLTTASSLYGSMFYFLVGCHAIHVIAALAALTWTVRAARSGRWSQTDHGGARSMRMYWVFVVLVWPPLYALVYLW